MIPYIIQVAAFQLVFLLIYDAFLKKETFFNWNRVYLLGTALLSIAIPFVKIEGFKNAVPQQYIINLPEVIIGKTSSGNSTQLQATTLETSAFWTWETLFYIGLILAALLFVFKISKVIWMLVKNPKNKLGNLLIVNLLNSNAAFSIFHCIFLGERLTESDKAAILKHEMVHVKQKHTLDLLFFEVMRILFWFNPLVYMYQNRVMTLHEFIADQEAVKHQGKTYYYQNLLSQVFQTQNISFINPFFKQSLIKKRIIMLQKSKSKQVKLLKYALLIPVVLVMLVYSSCEKENETNQIDALDLSQYSYTVKDEDFNSGTKISEEIKLLVKKQNAFLQANPNYVRWLTYDSKNQQTVNTVHPINEKAPDGYHEVNGRWADGTSFKVYSNSNFKNIPENKETEESNQQIEKYKNEIEVPFAFIEQVPVFPGCEGMTNAEQKQCVSQKITEHVGKNFNTSIANENSLTGRQRINVIFKIDKEGNVTGIRSRASHPALEAEAIRVVSLLPKMTPGTQKGKAVTVPYSLPIVFEVK